MKILLKTSILVAVLIAFGGKSTSLGQNTSAFSLGIQADKGDKKAMFELGRMYITGEGVGKNPEEGIKLWKKAGDLGNADALWALGMLSLNGDSVPQKASDAVVWWTKAAELGQLDAMVCLARAYENGSGVEANPSVSAQWYTKAAEKGSSAAQWELAYLYLNGEGVQRDENEAEKWFKECAKWFIPEAQKGNPRAQYCLARCYECGNAGLKQNDTLAANWYVKAAQQGDPRAMRSIAGMYLKGAGIEKNMIEARKWYEKSAELDIPLSQYQAAIMYYEGIGGEVDIDKAFYWFKKAAVNNVPQAYVNMGDFYISGKAVAKNIQEAMKWYRKSAEAGNTTVMALIGWSMLQGSDGIEKNTKVGLEMLEKAASSGNPIAENNLGAAYEQGVGVEKNKKTAIEWFTKSALHGYADAQVTLGKYLYTGDTVPLSKEEGLAWLIIATLPTAQSDSMPEIVKARKIMESELGAAGVNKAQIIANDIQDKYLNQSKRPSAENIEKIKEANAKNQCVQLATAINAYQVEYGHLPNFSGNHATINNIEMLTPKDKINNPHGVEFITTSLWNPGKGGTNNNGFCTPFGESDVYQVSLNNGTNGIIVPQDAAGSKTIINKQIGVWTILRAKGKNTLINSWD